MRTIHLEILRQGPPHNQLLSPLTEYLALCENHPAVPVRLPFEHADFVLRLYALQYRKEAEYRPLELEEVSRWMTHILAQVPGLIREMADQSGAEQSEGEKSAPGKDLIHLRLTLSANELALLPFELASASYVFGSAGEPMLLQSQTPVCITREGRRVPAKRLEWPPPPNPKILFAAAGPWGPIPLKEHLLVLRKVIDPWVSHHQDDSERRLRIDEHLKVLPQATLQQIEEECASANYTHVHILCHGIPTTRGDDRRYGLALHDRVDTTKPDIVDGLRFAKALRPPRRDSKGGFARPAIVTLAACDAGSVGGVTWSGASIAHAMHDEGIPLVVASQFPLSFPASVIMAKVLYTGFLGGEDPRTLLVNLRRELLTQSPSTHDWASIVAYASFPQTFDRQLSRTQTEQAFRRFEAAINHIDKNLRQDTTKKDWTDDQLRVQEARKRIDLLLDNEQEPRIYGILASAEKRMAEIWWRIGAANNKTREDLLDVRDRLMSARRFYEEAFKRDRSQVWALVQVLALTAVIRSWNKNEVLSLSRWQLARRFSEEELDLGNPDRWSWASANLMELYVLAPLIPHALGSDEDSIEKAEEYALKFVSLTEFTSINVHSTRRQMERYSGFFARINPDMQSVAVVADRMLEILPQSRTFS